MQWRAVAVVGPDLHQVANIDDERPGFRRDGVPDAVAFYLQSGNVILYEDRKGTRVSMVRNTKVALAGFIGGGVGQIGADGVVVQAQET